jgi:hypothetical protein
MTISQLKEEIQSIVEARGVKTIQKDYSQVLSDIEKALDFYKKNKNTDKKEPFIKLLKQLGDKKKKLAQELDDKVSGMYRNAEYQGESVNEASSDPQIISQLRDIVKNKQNQSLKDPKSGKKMRVDLYSANIITQVYDAIKSQSTKEKFLSGGLLGMQNMAFKVVNKK